MQHAPAITTIKRMPNPFLTDANAMKKRRGPNQEHRSQEHRSQEHHRSQTQEHHQGRENPFLTRPSHNHHTHAKNGSLESPVAAIIPAPQLSFEESFPSLSQSQGQSHHKGPTLNFKSAVQSNDKIDNKNDNKSDNKSDDKINDKSNDKIADKISTHLLNNQFLRPVNQFLQNQFLQPRSTNPHIRRGRNDECNECNEDDDNDAYDSAYTKYYED
jgi:hypothetical protein